MPTEANGSWLKTDEIEEFIGAIEFCADLSNSIRSDIRRWKWLILAMHNALQGCFVCALRGVDTSGITMLKNKSADAVWQWLNVDSRIENPPPAPKEELAPMLDLYRRVRNVKYLQEPYRLPTHQQMNKDIIKLNLLRNKFSHFTPQGFSLEISGLPRIIGHCSDIIEHLAITHPTFWHHPTENRRSRIEGAIASIRRLS